MPVDYWRLTEHHRALISNAQIIKEPHKINKSQFYGPSNSNYMHRV